MLDPLVEFSPPVRRWFYSSFGTTTPPQAKGWPAIKRGENVLILAPTGSGKTLAAFLAGVDEIYRELTEEGERPRAGVRLLYVSPLKALNNDIERNLRGPLLGIRAEATRMGKQLPALEVAVRTGDTPGSARQAMVTHPPHILITTPESLYLILTSPKARKILYSVRSVIVDEIHTLVGEKRGAHLALSLERLEQQAERRIQRIGLSATIQPLEEAARFLGGQETSGVARPVTIIDTGYKKPLDLQVVMPVPDFRDLPGNSIWPSVIPRVLGDVMRHRTTLIFANNRRMAERTADRLNAQIAAERSEEIAPGSTEALAPGGIMRDKGLFAIGAEGPIKAHHGSSSKEARREMEEQLKAGQLPALVSTGTLELGIDIGHVDLVVQLQSPRSVSQGLQRIGRSGHLVGQTSRGRIYATHREDLVEAAAVVQGMLEGAVEPTKTPDNPLDVLAQQIVAAVSVEPWLEKELYQVVRRAFPYRQLSQAAWESVLAMLSGRFQSYGGPGHASLRARILWERETGRLAPLPGTRLLALGNPGTIPDTGAFNVVLADGKTRIGTLDEEFVFETRTGDVFMLGSSVWRVLNIEDDKIVVGEAAGSMPRMPFWRGDYPWRSYELGVRIGRLRRDVAATIKRNADQQDKTLVELRREYALDDNSARALLEYVSRQVDALGAISSDDTIIVETFGDAVGEARLVVHSPFGGRVNGAWALALVDAMRERTGMEVESQVSDDGILLRFPGALLGAEDIGMVGPGVPQKAAQAGMNIELAARIVAEMTVDEARQRILRELPNSAMFGARFRMNAARALLLPRARGGKRTPFWLQRMKARDLLATVRNIPDFPLIAETYRDCLRDVLDLGHLDELLAGIQDRRVRVLPVQSRVPSPLAAGLMYAFAQTYVYEWDTPKAEQRLQALTMRRELVEDLLDGAESGRVPVKAEILSEVLAGAGEGRKARSADELAVLLLELGDLTESEIAERSAGDWRAWMAELLQRGAVTEIPRQWREAEKPSADSASATEPRWVSVETGHEYEGLSEARQIIRRYLRWSGPVTHAQLLARYRAASEVLDDILGELLAARDIVQGHFRNKQDARELEYLDRQLFEQLFRRTLAALRRDVQPVSLAAFQDFVLRWQGIGTPTHKVERSPAEMLGQLRGLALPATAWEREVFPARVRAYRSGVVDELLRSGEYAWVCVNGNVRYLKRREGALFLSGTAGAQAESPAAGVLEYLKSEGVSFFADIAAGTNLGEEELRGVLRELATAGVVQGEDLTALDAVLQGRGEQVKRGPSSTLEEELATRLPPRPLGRTRAGSRTPPSRLRGTRRTMGQRLEIEASEDSAWRGRWAIVHRAAVLGAPRSPAERGSELALVALKRYGVVTHELVQRNESRWVWGETIVPSEVRWEWGEIYDQLLRMELRGEVRRGYFVRGLSGVQFALPAAVEALREARDSEGDEVTVLSAIDPANLHGGELPGWNTEETEKPEGRLRFSRLTSTHVVLWRGQAVLVGEDNGTRLHVGEVDPGVLTTALEAYLNRPGAPQRVAIATWNGDGVLGSAGERLLREMGASRSPTGLDWWRA
jgi:ATP-dependent helicase Lhr and Lhr-like helicase